MCLTHFDLLVCPYRSLVSGRIPDTLLYFLCVSPLSLTRLDAPHSRARADSIQKIGKENVLKFLRFVSVWTAADGECRTAAPGLKPLRLPRTRAMQGRSRSWITTVHNFCGLACIFGITSPNNQGRSKSEFSQKLDLGLSEGQWRNDVTSHFRHISSHSRFDVTLPGFEKVFLYTKNVTIFLEPHRNIIFLGLAWNKT